MRLLTTKEAADFLQVSTDTVYRMLDRDEIPAGKISGSWRFVQDDLVEWLRSKYANTTQTTQAEPCRTNAKEPVNGGSLSAEYASLLGLKTRKPLQHSKPN